MIVWEKRGGGIVIGAGRGSALLLQRGRAFAGEEVADATVGGGRSTCAFTSARSIQEGVSRDRSVEKSVRDLG